ncbi:CHAT domain-containing protein [Streptomyces sp. NBC_00322]|uniref:CHAT domain-containing tetratricopeptide repeat protein n=1 Tax=Streptomyces sp. NBC_00322 TaxID=2975712 RepID=UPI002E2A0746|nr:CHAT domain-containing protein [Streptomyces sp. NBC_00322]
MDAYHALGRLHVAAYEALPSHAQAGALKAAVRALTPCFLAGFTPLPATLLPFLAEESAQLAVDFARSAADRRSIDQAVSLLQDITSALPSDYQPRALQLSNLGSTLIKRALLTGSASDKGAAVHAYQEAAAMADATGRAKYLYSLAVSLRMVFHRTGEPADLDQAITACEKAIAATPTPFPELVVVLADLSTDLSARATMTGSLSDVHRAVKLSEQAAQAAGRGSPQHFHCLYVRAFIRLTRFHWTGSAEDLDLAESIYRQLLGTAPLASPYRTVSEIDLGTVLLNRFKQTRMQSHLDDAITIHDRALAAVPQGHPERWRVLLLLGEELRDRFADRNDPKDIDRAVTLMREAVSYTIDGHPGRAAALGSLGMALRVRHEWKRENGDGHGQISDLDQAIEFQKRALALTPEDHAARAGLVSDLGTSYTAKFQVTGNLKFLNRAVQLSEQSVADTPPEHPERGTRLYNLAAALQERYQRVCSREDLERAVEVAQDLVTAVDAGDWSRARAVSTSSRAHYTRFLREGTTDDLTLAIDRAQEAATITSTSDPERARWLSNLAAMHLERFNLVGTPQDVDCAVENAKLAVDAIPPGRPDRPGCLNTHAVARLTRYRLRHAIEDLRAAENAFQEALAVIPVDHPERASMLINRADLFAAAPGRTAAAVDDYISATDVVTAPPSLRIRAARAAAGLLADSAPGRAADLLALAVSLLPETVPRQLHRRDQQYALKDFAELANDAAALILTAPSHSSPDDAARALALLEQGRGVLLSQALDTRNELSALEESEDPDHRALAGEYTLLRDALDDVQTSDSLATRLTGAASESRLQDNAIADRHLLNEKFASVVARIREINGFETFHLPPPAQEFLTEAAHGPVVVYNVSRYGCGALLITPSCIEYLPLDRLARTTLIDMVNVFHAGLQTIGRKKPSDNDKPQLKEWLKEWETAQNTLSEVLEWLWEVAAEPVLTALGMDGSKPHRGDRIWWATGGLLSLLPLHAAGLHREAPKGDTDRGRMSVMDRVISSYTPTVRALRYARRPAASTEQTEALIVAMPTTPQAPPLPNVRAEARMLQQRLSNHVLLMEDPSTTPSETTPTTVNVRAALSRCAIAHFACHGSVHPSDPSLSKLLLHDPEDPLTVSSLASVRLESARLAYLSACRTAAVVADELIDESIHLTSAFQLAGFRHVVGTLWTINDLISVDVATSFYARATTDSGAFAADHADHDVALHLHDAVLAVRDKHASRPSLWASYIHSGA